MFVCVWGGVYNIVVEMNILETISTQKYTGYAIGSEVNLNMFQFLKKMTLVISILIQIVSKCLFKRNSPTFKRLEIIGILEFPSTPTFQRARTTLGKVGECDLSTPSPFHPWKNQKLLSVAEGRTEGLAKNRKGCHSNYAELRAVQLAS